MHAWILLALTACAGSPEPAPSPSPSADAAPSSDAAPASTAPAASDAAPAAPPPWDGWTSMDLSDALARELSCRSSTHALHLYPEGRLYAAPLDAADPGAPVDGTWTRDGDDVLLAAPDAPDRLADLRAWRSGLAFHLAGREVSLACRITPEAFPPPDARWFEVRDAGAGDARVAEVSRAALQALTAPLAPPPWMAPGPDAPAATGVTLRWHPSAGDAADEVRAALGEIVDRSVRDDAATAPFVLVIGGE